MIDGNLKTGLKSQALINVLSEDLGCQGDTLPLLNNYDAYRRLVAQWSSDFVKRGEINSESHLGVLLFGGHGRRTAECLRKFLFLRTSH